MFIDAVNLKKIGDYQLGSIIGRGSYGVVFKALKRGSNKVFAVKVCTSRDDNAKKRFYREAEISSSLKHPNITNVYEYGYEDGIPYIVEEYLDGEDLSSKINARTPLFIEQKLDYLLQILSGLDYAHRNGIVHRDIKPGNVFILFDDTAKILDFGTAKRFAGKDQTLTRAGVTVGTAAYLSPEQLSGHQATPESDIFSFGVLAYELLAGRRPFPATRIAEVLYQILREDPVPIESLWPDCPPDISYIIHTCLDKDPSKRFSTAGEVKIQLASAARKFIVDRGVERIVKPSVLISWTKSESLRERAEGLLKEGEHVIALLAATTALKSVDASEYTFVIWRKIWKQLGHPPSYIKELAKRFVKQPEVEEDVENAQHFLTSLQACLYIGDIAQAVELLSKKGRLLPEYALREAQKQLVARMVGMQTALFRDTVSFLKKGLEKARKLIAQQQWSEAEKIISVLRLFPDPDNEIEEVEYVLTTSRKFDDPEMKIREAILSIKKLLDKGKILEALEAFEFAVSLHGLRDSFFVILDNIKESIFTEFVLLQHRRSNLLTYISNSVKDRIDNLNVNHLSKLFNIINAVDPGTELLVILKSKLDVTSGKLPNDKVGFILHTVAELADRGMVREALVLVIDLLNNNSGDERIKKIVDSLRRFFAEYK